MDSALGKKETLVVRGASDALYEVGPDVLLSMTSFNSRTLDLDFVKRDGYLALVRGALAYMNVPNIDFLVVGLPVSTMDTMAPFVKTMLLGEHPIPDGSVVVQNVLVVPQPVGGMYDFGVRNSLMSDLEATSSLLIDPGYFTLDWVIVRGVKMVGARSGAASNAGVSAILRQIIHQIGAKSGARDQHAVEVSESVLDRLDIAIREKSAFKFYGKFEPIEEYLASPSPIVLDALSKLRARVGSLDDIDRVIIVGGGAHLYEAAVLKMFPGFDVRVAKNQVFSNVRGFQMMGNVAMQKRIGTAHA